MTKDGHRLTGFIVGVAAIFSGSPISFGVAVLFGATAPDTLEISYRNKDAYNGYGRVLPHRTITHWAPLWLLVAAFLRYGDPLLQFGFTAAVGDFLYELSYGYILGALLHIFCDAGTPMGVPIWQPFGRRYSFGLYKTGGAEWGMVVLVSLLAVGWVAVNPYILDCLVYFKIQI